MPVTYDLSQIIINGTSYTPDVDGGVIIPISGAVNIVAVYIVHAYFLSYLSNLGNVSATVNGVAVLSGSIVSIPAGSTVTIMVPNTV